MKRKIGPLPLWAWIALVGGTLAVVIIMRRGQGSSSSASANTVDPSSPNGLTYGQEAQDAAMGIDPITGESYAQEQAAQQAADQGQSGGGGSAGGGTGFDPTQLLDNQQALSDQLSLVNDQLSALQTGGLTDQQTPEQTFAGELGDLASGITALQALQAVLAPHPATAAKPKAGKGKHPGSGKAGHTGGKGAKPPARRTTTHKPKKTPPRRPHTPPARHVVSGHRSHTGGTGARLP